LKSCVIISTKNSLRDYLITILNSNEYNIFTCESVSEAIKSVSVLEPRVIYIGHSLNVDTDISQLNSKIIELCNKGSILFGTNNAIKKSSPKNYFNYQLNINNIEKRINEILHLKQQSNYVPLEIQSLIDFKLLDFDLYLKVGNHKYTKVYSCAEKDFEVVKKYITQGIKFLYISNDNYINFIGKFKKNHIVDYGNRNTREIFLDTIDYSTQFLKEISFEIEENPFFDGYINSLLNRVTSSRHSFFKEIESSIADEKANFNLKVNTLTMLLAFHLSESLEKNLTFEWNTKQITEKLLTASIMHNAEISDRPDLIKITTPEQFDELDILSKKLVNSHAARIHSKSILLKNLDTDVNRILIEQHGSKSGYGINNLPTEFKLSQLFKICSDLSVKLIEFYESDNTTLEDVFKSEALLKGPNYEKHYDILLKKIVL